MNRKELVAAVADAAELEQKTVDAVLRSLQSTLEGAAVKGERVSVSGFFALSVGDPAAREDRNPATGATIKIPAAKTGKLTAGKTVERVSAASGAGTRSGFGVVVFEEPVRGSDVSHVLEESLGQAAAVIKRLDAASSRLESTAPAVLAALESLSMTLPAGAEDPTLTLTADEESVLRETGSLARPFPDISTRASFRSVARMTAVLASALTVKEAAARLGVSAGRVRQRLADRTLYGMQEQDGWRLPAFQFEAGGGQVRGLSVVLPALPPSMHPLSVLGFLAMRNVDLPSADGDAQSPISWLQGGGRADTVVALAHDLARR